MTIEEAAITGCGVDLPVNGQCDYSRILRMRKRLSAEELFRICAEEEKWYREMIASWGTDCQNEDKTQQLCDSIDTLQLSSSSSSGSVENEEDVKANGYEQFREHLKMGAQIPEFVLRAQTIYCARVGLTHYNMKHGTRYKLVDAKPFVSSKAFDIGTGLHCNFMAAEESPLGLMPAPKLFYTDFHYFELRIWDVTCCIVNDPAQPYRRWCTHCPRELAHCPCPRHRYRQFYERKYHLSELVEAEANEKAMLATKALAFYNTKHGTNYELVKEMKPLRHKLRRDNSLQGRLFSNFMAKRSSDAVPELFFAETAEKFSKTTVIQCCILDCAADALHSKLDTLKELDITCWICTHNVRHPSYLGGCTTPPSNGSCLRRPPDEH